jgi:predicted DNA-binding ribbon-helix-helix protein
MHGKRIRFDDETWLALDVLARDRMMTFQELADEAFDDLLKKYHRPANLKSALKQSVDADLRGPATGSRQKKANKGRARTPSS